MVQSQSASNTKVKELTQDEIQDLIDQLPRTSLVSFTGGEPFLRRDMMDILKYTATQHRCHIITNGTLLSEGIAEELVNIGSRNILGRGLLLIGISLQGPEDVHTVITHHQRAYQRTLEGVKRLRAYRRTKGRSYPLINLKAVICKQNVHTLSHIFSIAEDLEVDICNFIVENRSDHFQRLNLEKGELKTGSGPPGPWWTLEDLSILQRELERIQRRAVKARAQVRFSPQNMPPHEIVKYYANEIDLQKYICYAPWSKIGISAYGDVGLCHNYIFGNIREQRLRDIWYGGRIKQFRKTLKAAKVFPSCNGCCFLERDTSVPSGKIGQGDPAREARRCSRLLNPTDLEVKGSPSEDYG